MTSTPVNVQGVAPVTAMYGATKVQETQTNGDFSKIFESQKNAANDVNKTEYAENDFQDEKYVDKADEVNQETLAETSKTEAQKESSSVQEKAETQPDKSSTDKDMAEDELTAEEMEKAAEVLQNAVVDMKAVLMQELGLTSEELDTLMQEMNLTDADLLQVGNLKDMMLQLAGAQDMMAVLTNEELYSQMQNLEAAFSEVMEAVQDSLGMTSEEVSGLLDTVNMEGTMTGEVTVEMATVDLQQAKTGDATEEQTSQGEQTDESNAFAAQNPLNAQNNIQTEATQTTATTSTFSSAETQNIMNQIMDYMNIQMSAETTEVNMQLQPESLGTLQIRISAKEGVMTAQFTTASEAVKSVLESQMVMLQQQFDQQNIKVEAIEVTVQTHQFESALEQGNEKQTAEEDSKKNRTRKIDLTRLDEMDEIATEDQILAEMMAANGNSVDYLA